MKKCALILSVILFLNASIAEAVVYECTYKTKNGAKATAAFNPIQKHRNDYSELSYALRSGNCKELIVKRYLIDATSCNIQFYKYNGKIANLTCRGNKPETMQKLKEIALKDFGYKQ